MAAPSDSATSTTDPTDTTDTTDPSDTADPVEGMPNNFVRVRDLIPDAEYEIRYAGEHNFVGRPITGYRAPECWLTRAAAEALVPVQRRVKRAGYTLKFYDCFRPQRAVDDFVSWSHRPDDTTTKAEFYPDLDKSVLFPEGYIAERSGHSRGSTFDVTLVPLGKGVSPKWRVGDPQVACTSSLPPRFPDTSIDMGTGFDCFDPLANTANPGITARQAANRALLVRQLRRAGFTNYDKEWWHFTLANEPYPDTYFDAPITHGR